MRRRLQIAAVLAYMLAASTSHAPGPVLSPADCPTGLCPLQQAQQPAAPASATSPIVRVTCYHQPQGNQQFRDHGTGTLVDATPGGNALVITNWHVVACDANEPPIEQIVVYFPGGFSSQARILKADRLWDLAALEIACPPGPAQPVALADDVPQVGETLSIVGYGSNNQARQEFGPVTKFLAPAQNQPYELIEVAVVSEQGDSGGPILTPSGKLCGVLFGSNGQQRITAGAHCGPVRRFLHGLGGRFSRQNPTPTAQTPSRHAPKQAYNQPQPAPGSTLQPLPAKPQPGPAADPAAPIVRTIPGPEAYPPAEDTANTEAPRWRPTPNAPIVNTTPPPAAKPAIPPAVGSIVKDVGAFAISKGLVYLGLSVPVAGVAGSALTWFIMRRARKRLAARNDGNTNTPTPPTPPASSQPAAAAFHTVLDRTANVYVDRPLPELEAEAYREAARRIMPLQGNKTMTFAAAIEILEGTKDLVYQGARVVSRRTNPSAWKNDPPPQ